MPEDKLRSLDPRRVAAGKWLKEKRLEAGLTQQALARRVGFDDYPSMISQIEVAYKGARIPREKYIEFARALKMDPKEFAWEQLRFYEPEFYQILQSERSGKQK